MKTEETPFFRLKLLFHDEPEVLKLLDPVMLDPNKAEDETLSENIRKDKIFSSVVNLYVTGKSRVGKTTFGNKLFNKDIMPSTGHADCTDALYLVRIGNFLYYFDLPGAGSDEDYENINRAILLMKSDDLPSGFKFVDQEKGKETIIPLNRWEASQDDYEPNICIYMIAPHIGMFADDVVYLEDLLGSFRQRFGNKNRVIFVLNLHTFNGQPSYNERQIENVTRIITKSFTKFYPDTNLPVVRINAQESNGFNEFTKEVCNLLELSQIQTFYQDIVPDLKKQAEGIRKERFFRLLSFVAARLSVRKADSSVLESNFLYEAYISIYVYGSMVISGHLKISDEELQKNAKAYSQQSVNDKTRNETKSVPETEKVDIFEKIKVPQYHSYETTINEPITEAIYRKIPRDPIFGLGVRDFFSPVYGTVYETRYQARTIVKNDLVGYKEEIINVGTVEKIVGYKEEVIGQKVLIGGLDFIIGVFSLGLGIEKATEKAASDKNNQYSFERIFELGSVDAKNTIVPHKDTIENIFLNIKDQKEAENRIRALLSKIFKFQL